MPIVERLSTIDRLAFLLKSVIKRSALHVWFLNLATPPSVASLANAFHHEKWEHGHRCWGIGNGQKASRMAWPICCLVLFPAATSTADTILSVVEKIKIKEKQCEFETGQRLEAWWKIKRPKTKPQNHPVGPKQFEEQKVSCQRVPSGYKWRETKKARQIKRETQEADTASNTRADTSYKELRTSTINCLWKKIDQNQDEILWGWLDHKKCKKGTMKRIQTPSFEARRPVLEGEKLHTLTDLGTGWGETSGHRVCICTHRHPPHLPSESSEAATQLTGLASESIEGIARGVCKSIQSLWFELEPSALEALKAFEALSLHLRAPQLPNGLHGRFPPLHWGVVRAEAPDAQRKHRASTAIATWSWSYSWMA